MLRIVTLVLAAALLGTVGCGSTETTAATPSGIRSVSPAEASALAAEEGVEVIDVRTPGEFAGGHLADATLVDFEALDFASRIGELERDGRYVVYCRSGNRSAQAVARMEELGFTDVADVEGGILAWEAADLPVVR